MNISTKKAIAYPKKESISYSMNLYNKKSNGNSSVNSTSRQYDSERKMHMRVNSACDINKSLTSNSKGKVLLESVNERKSYENRIKLINTRIKKLTCQTSEINKKVDKLQDKYAKHCLIKTEKTEFKKLKTKAKINIADAITQKRQEAEQMKKEQKQTLENVVKEKASIKKKNYNSCKADQQILHSVKDQLKTADENQHKFKYLKLKQEGIAVKAERYKKKVEIEDKAKARFSQRIDKERQQTEQLKSQIDELEKTEIGALENLKKTIFDKKANFESFKKKLNTSMNVSMDESASPQKKYRPVKTLKNNNSSLNSRPQSTFLKVNPRKLYN